MNIPIYTCLIDENPDNQSGIYAISFVEQPANQSHFIALQQELQPEQLNIDSHKQILTGVVLRPEQLIYRNSAQQGEHYIQFSAQQIEKIAHKMMRTNIALHTTTHQHTQPLQGNYLIEMWIVEDPLNDKSAALGFKNLPKGTLMCSYKIEDKNYWDSQVLTGNVNGFSLEGFFIKQPIHTSKQPAINPHTHMNKKEQPTLLSKISNFFLDIQNVGKQDATLSGITYLTFTLSSGKEVYVDADGFATIDGEQMPAGEHLLADGNTLVVDQQGQFVETKTSALRYANPQQATAPQALASKTPQPTADLNTRVAELETKVAELQTRLDEFTKQAKADVEALQRITPSTQPRTQMHTHTKAYAQLPHTQRMAASLSMQVQRRMQ
ncbi:MAG: hypothetical protein RL662_445 [Bacteroidota bacterium]|jgi:exonuclease VII large subunit